ncbi:glutamine amidotransferase [Sphingomonas quercus]|uniref:Glutamine amidotransferase n=1 Tax=Sphingomonas quercus TaxID=2842451 RepID=A0ABS6BH82_9SPHN|nr:glutamine amidotransferase [Sphingomonas quercus]MBU3076629.1 glutamine amidotransferase [Sphingomonas quercus]
MKKGLIIRHVPYEGIAGFRAPVEQAGFVLDRIDVADPEFHAVDYLAPDLLVVMGGPMGVYEHADHPWIPRELDGLAARLDAGRPTLGVCFGSQMIAAALGKRVYAGPVKEVGYAPLRLTAAGLASPLRHLAEVPILHWHGDTFELPDDVELLASTEAYPHQVFRRGRALLALQCHAEMGEDPRFDAWLENVDYIAEAGTDIATLRADNDRHGAHAVAAGRRMITEWLAELD